VRVNILVCIKEVPDMEGTPRIDPAHRWFAAPAAGAYRMNRYDEYALEEAVQIKEAFPAIGVDALSVGPPRVETTLRRAMGKGADNAIHILDDAPGYRSPQTTAALIAAYARSKSYDLILTGVMAEDDLQCQVGPMAATMLAFPCASGVTRTCYEPQSGTITVDCEMQAGLSTTAILTLPALLTIQSGINRPRYPSLSKLLRARKQSLTTIEGTTLLRTGAHESIHSIRMPANVRQGITLTGSAAEKAAKFLEIAYSKSLLRCHRS
jgi:electron transfer flavoprotein beta subunit